MKHSGLVGIGFTKSVVNRTGSGKTFGNVRFGKWGDLKDKIEELVSLNVMKWVSLTYPYIIYIRHYSDPTIL